MSAVYGWLSERNAVEDRINNGLPAPSDSPLTLPLSDIRIIEEVFQHRSGNLAATDAHVAALAKSIGNSEGQPLDRVWIFWIGDGWCCIDGHHRLEAYKRAGYYLPIPVVVFKGTLDHDPSPKSVPV